MPPIHEFIPFGPASYYTSSEASLRSDGVLGTFAHFECAPGDGRSESRLIYPPGSPKEPGTRWFPTDRLVVMTWEARLDFDSEGRWDLIWQQKFIQDDETQATPSRAIDCEFNRWKGPAMFVVRITGQDKTAVLFTAAELAAIKGKVIQFKHVEYMSKDPAKGLSSMSWKYKGDTAWQRVAKHTGKNLRDNVSGKATWTLGVYRDPASPDTDYHDVSMNPGPRWWATEQEADAALGIDGVIVPPPPPDIPTDPTDPCAGVRAELGRAVSDLNGAREARDMAISSKNTMRSDLAAETLRHSDAVAAILNRA